MNQTFCVKPVGHIRHEGGEFLLVLEEEFRCGLKALEGFSHVQLLFWFHHLDGEEYRRVYEMEAPYKSAPEVMGVFATRSPVRPNPIGLTACPVIGVDSEKGVIRLAYTDADDHTPVLDIKPYTPSVDVVRDYSVPEWCGHWPRCMEDSEGFNWEEEFNFPV